EKSVAKEFKVAAAGLTLTLTKIVEVARFLYVGFIFGVTAIVFADLAQPIVEENRVRSNLIFGLVACMKPSAHSQI
uniref:Uncharacterized protein n=1 Tax=Romanomermis culicivorax TaxID=13658 RepID=A0A915KKI0_ROMCU